MYASSPALIHVFIWVVRVTKGLQLLQDEPRTASGTPRRGQRARAWARRGSSGTPAGPPPQSASRRAAPARARTSPADVQATVLQGVALQETLLQPR